MSSKKKPDKKLVDVKKKETTMQLCRDLQQKQRFPAPRSFFDETLDLFRDYVPVAGGIMLGCEILGKELEQNKCKPVPLVANSISRISFPFQKEIDRNATPSLSIIFASSSIEVAAKNYPNVLVIVENLPAFFRSYPEGAKDARLQGICIGGFVNLGSVPSYEEGQLALSLLTHWVLCGPFFDAFWESRSFDLIYPQQKAKFFLDLIRYIGECWEANLEWYSHHEERVLYLRKKAELFRNTSSSILTISEINDVFQTRFVEWLCQPGELKRVSLIHELGWDNKNRRWDMSLRRMLAPETLLTVVEKNEPAFALETNWFNSPLQSFYWGKVSPKFILNRSGIPLHHLVVDPPFSVSVLIWDSLAELFSRSSLAFFYSPRRCLPNSIRVSDYSFPSIIVEDPDSSFQERKKFAKINSFALNKNKLTGFFMATNFRKEITKNIPKALRIYSLLLSVTLKKWLGSDKFTYFSFFYLLQEAMSSMLSVVLSRVKDIHFSYVVSVVNSLGLEASILHSIVKLAVASDSIKYATNLGLPFYIYCPGQWAGGSSANWRGYLQKDAVDALGCSGWGRISPQLQFAKEPFHDVSDALENGYLCLGINAHRVEDTDLFSCIAPCTFTTPSVLHDRMKNLYDNPVGFFDAMRHAYSDSSPTVQKKEAFCSEDALSLFDRLRLLPDSSYLEGVPVNLVSLLCLAPPISNLLNEFNALESLLLAPQGVSPFLERLSEEEKNFAYLLCSFLDL